MYKYLILFFIVGCSFRPNTHLPAKVVKQYKNNIHDNCIMLGAESQVCQCIADSLVSRHNISDLLIVADYAEAEKYARDSLVAGNCI